MSLEWQLKDKWQYSVLSGALQGAQQDRLTRLNDAIREALRPKGRPEMRGCSSVG